MLAHWGRSMHSDHENACRIADRARFLAGLPGHREPDAARHAVGRLLHTENWEDAPGFIADTCVEISAEAHRLWTEGISGQAFARGDHVCDEAGGLEGLLDSGAGRVRGGRSSSPVCLPDRVT